MLASVPMRMYAKEPCIPLTLMHSIYTYDALNFPCNRKHV